MFFVVSIFHMHPTHHTHTIAHTYLIHLHSIHPIRPPFFQAADNPVARTLRRWRRARLGRQEGRRL